MNIIKMFKTTIILLLLCFITVNCSIIREKSNITPTIYNIDIQPYATPQNTKVINLPSITTTPTRQITAAIINPMTPIPTSLSQETETKWREILINPICRLPCWWGVNPGITTGNGARKLLEPFGLNLVSAQVSNNSTSYGAPFQFLNLRLINYFSLLEENEIIEVIHVQGEGLNNPVNFHELWVKYTPQSLLLEYSYPSRIVIQTRKNSIQPEDLAYKYFDLSLFYDQLGFVITYRGKIKNTPQHTICPTYDGNLLSEIQIYTQSPESQIPLEIRMGENYGPGDTAYSIEFASDLTINKFYDLLTSDEEPKCFDTIGDIWPP